MDMAISYNTSTYYAFADSHSSLPKSQLIN